MFKVGKIKIINVIYIYSKLANIKDVLVSTNGINFKQIKSVNFQHANFQY